MKAVVITKPGGPEVLELREVPKPVPQADQVLVRVRACGINRADLMQNQGQYPDRYNLQGSASYVTGSHNVKAGAQWNWGPYRRTRVGNADLVQRYTNGAPNSVAVYNTPIEWTDRLNADLGVFAQDAWTLRRLTVNAGVRWEYFNSEVSASASP